MRLAVLPLCLELQEYRGDDGKARCPSHIRNGPELVRQVRSFYAFRLRKNWTRIGTKWHLNEVFLKMKQQPLWRAVGQNGVVIDSLVQSRRDRWAALRFFHKLLHTAGISPRVIVTDKLGSYAAAKD